MYNVLVVCSKDCTVLNSVTLSYLNSLWTPHRVNFHGWFLFNVISEFNFSHYPSRLEMLKEARLLHSSLAQKKKKARMGMVGGLSVVRFSETRSL